MSFEFCIIIYLRWLLSTNQNESLKPVLWFCYVLAKKCSRSVFTTDELQHKLVDLLEPIAAEEVLFNAPLNIYQHIFAVSLGLLESSGPASQRLGFFG